MPLHVAVLDVFPDNLYPVMDREIPPDWICHYATDYAMEAQKEVVREAEIIFAGWAPTGGELLNAAPNLRFIQKTGVGVDKVDFDTCRARGIGVCRLGGGNAETVAEHVFLQVLALYRRLPLVDRRVRQGEWFKEEARGIHREIRGKTVGLIGFGYVGRAIAKRMHAFGAKVIYYDVKRPDPATEAELHVSFMELDDLIRTADIVSIHVPYQPSTRNILNAERIASLKPDAVVVNCARGGLLDEAALEQALRERRIFGAAIDCWDREAAGPHPFHQLENTILTPHIAGTTIDNWGFVMQRVVSNSQKFLKGEPLPPDDVVYLPDSYGR